MVTLDESSKVKLSSFMDDDGKLKITDDMPEDLKAAISYLNENNVSLFSPTDESAYIEDNEPDPFAPGFVDESSDDDTEELDTDEEDIEDEEDEENDSVDELADVF